MNYIMSKLKLLQIAVIGLLLINIAALGWLFFGRPGHPPRDRSGREGPADIIIERLHFDQQQVHAYDKLISQHRSTIRRLDGEILETKNALYNTLANDSSQAKDSLQEKLGALQKEIETVHYDHFLEIKKLCKPSQAGYFNELTNDLAGYFSPGKNRPPHQDGPPE
jgi:protein CpxP